MNKLKLWILKEQVVLDLKSVNLNYKLKWIILNNDYKIVNRYYVVLVIIRNYMSKENKWKDNKVN